jgi:DNA-binding NarL/FixJ family response regulator
MGGIKIAELNDSALPYRHLKRRKEIRYLLAQGLTVWEVAQHTGKTEKVVKWHIGRMNI